MPFLHHPPSIHPSIHSSTGQNGWGYTAVTTKNPQWHQPQWLNTGNVCFLLTLFGLGAGRGAVSPIWRQGKWGAMPWPRPFCFYVVLADGNDRATPPSKDGCLWWVGVGGGSYLHPERCHSPSLPPAQLCHISLQASANSLGSRGDQAHSAQGRKGPAVCLSQSTCDCLDGTGRWAPKGVPDPLSRPLQAEGAAPRCSAPTSGPCYYTRGP